MLAGVPLPDTSAMARAQRPSVQGDEVVVVAADLVAGLALRRHARSRRAAGSSRGKRLCWISRAICISRSCRCFSQVAPGGGARPRGRARACRARVSAKSRSSSVKAAGRARARPRPGSPPCAAPTVSGHDEGQARRAAAGPGRRPRAGPRRARGPVSASRTGRAPPPRARARRASPLRSAALVGEAQAAAGAPR